LKPLRDKCFVEAVSEGRNGSLKDSFSFRVLSLCDYKFDFAVPFVFGGDVIPLLALLLTELIKEIDEAPWVLVDKPFSLFVALLENLNDQV